MADGIASLDRHAVSLHRLAHRLSNHGFNRLAAAVVAINKIVCGVEIEFMAQIGPNFRIVHGIGLVINHFAVIGENCTLYHGVTLGTTAEYTPGQVIDRNAVAPRLGNGVIVYAGAKILGPVTIGDGAIIGANAVVLQDVPAGKIAVGVPARVLDPKPVGAAL